MFWKLWNMRGVPVVGVAGRVDTLPKFDAGESLRTIPVRACLLLLLLDRSRTCVGSVTSSRVSKERLVRTPAVPPNVLGGVILFSERTQRIRASDRPKTKKQQIGPLTLPFSGLSFLFSVKSFGG